MKNILKKLISVLTVLLLVVGLGGCNTVKEERKDIYILYTNDVHCGLDDYIGYAGLKAYKDELSETNEYVALVDNGDFLQGSSIGTLTKGKAIVQLMNDVGYDVATLGNHDYDYGLDELMARLTEANFDLTTTNTTYTGSSSVFNEKNNDYVIKTYGPIKVAYIGVTTPETITTTTPEHLKENGEFVVSFMGGEDPTALYNKVQESIDAAKKEADYVIILSHLGTDPVSEPYCSYNLIQNTTGVDAVLDGHSHTVIDQEIVLDKEGNEVILSSTGTKLQFIGQLLIDTEGNLSTTLIEDYDTKDETITNEIAEINAEFEDILNTEIGTNEETLSIYTKGIRTIRNREMGIGDFVTDAYRNGTNADIAILNGGGIRDDLPAGTITNNSLLTINPFGNMISVCKATGQQIIDALEYGSKDVMSEYSDGSTEVGAFGGFLQVSGIRYTIDTSIKSPVVMDGDGNFISVDGTRRVSNVQVLEDGQYVDIDPDKEYTVASINFLLFLGGDGYTMFMNDDFVLKNGALDIDYLVGYVEYLGGTIPASYATPDGRITIK